MAKHYKIEPYHSPYAKLAAAILASGKKCDDTLFLMSDWADILREICRLDDLMYGDRNVRVTRGQIEVVG